MAASVRAPTAVSASVQLPAATVPVQELVPSLTVTLPDGVPLVVELVATLKLTVTACPTTDGSGVSEVMTMLVSALLMSNQNVRTIGQLPALSAVTVTSQELAGLVLLKVMAPVV